MLSKNAHNHAHLYYYQCLKLLLLIVTLIVVTPLLSSSLRFKHLFFIVNILIIAVGAEAGLVSFFLRSKKPCFPENENIKNLFTDKESITADHGDEYQSDNGVRSVDKVFVDDEKLPSIFFVGGGDQNQTENINVTTDDQELIMEDDDDEEELFQKAEIFIGNFYKQLKMQREESRRRLADNDILIN